MAQLVRREPAPDTGAGGEPPELAAHRGPGPRRPPVRPSMMHNSGPTGSSARAASHGHSCSQPHSSMPTSRRRPPLPRRTSSEPRRWSRSCSASASTSCSRSPARHNTTIIARMRQPCRSLVVWRITATISSRSADRPDTASPCYPAIARRDSPASSRANGAVPPRPTAWPSDHLQSDSRSRRCPTRRPPTGHRSLPHTERQIGPESEQRERSGSSAAKVDRRQFTHLLLHARSCERRCSARFPGCVGRSTEVVPVPAERTPGDRRTAPSGPMPEAALS